jgi:hypothetical protein
MKFNKIYHQRSKNCLLCTKIIYTWPTNFLHYHINSHSLNKNQKKLNLEKIESKFYYKFTCIHTTHKTIICLQVFIITSNITIVIVHQILLYYLLELDLVAHITSGLKVLSIQLIVKRNVQHFTIKVADKRKNRIVS